jgi:hypothetical protein
VLLEVSEFRNVFIDNTQSLMISSEIMLQHLVIESDTVKANQQLTIGTQLKEPKHVIRAKHPILIGQEVMSTYYRDSHTRVVIPPTAVLNALDRSLIPTSDSLNDLDIVH